MSSTQITRTQMWDMKKSDSYKTYLAASEQCAKSFAPDTQKETTMTTQEEKLIDRLDESTPLYFHDDKCGGTLDGRLSETGDATICIRNMSDVKKGDAYKHTLCRHLVDALSDDIADLASALRMHWNMDQAGHYTYWILNGESGGIWDTDDIGAACIRAANRYSLSENATKVLRWIISMSGVQEEEPTYVGDGYFRKYHGKLYGPDGQFLNIDGQPCKLNSKDVLNNIARKCGHHGNFALSLEDLVVPYVPMSALNLNYPP